MSVVVCCYTQARWNELVEAIEGVRAQLAGGDELVVVVDHEPALLERLRAAVGGTVVENAGARGLSGARNTGVKQAVGDVVVFLDDDAVPEPGWLDSLRDCFRDPAVTGVGGAIRPRWEGGRAPRWFPVEFGWVIGCDYRGLPSGGSAIRNPIGASMAVRRDVLDEVGGFSELVGRVGELPVGCEETELAIRVRQRDPSALFVRDERAVVRHLVPAGRQRVRYFVRRCYHEGRSKAVLSGVVGSQDGLSSERDYVRSVLPSGVGRNVKAVLDGDGYGAARAALIVTGLAATAAGFGVAKLRTTRDVAA